eukprot:1476750-Rhodomonas_salina.1
MRAPPVRGGADRQTDGKGRSTDRQTDGEERSRQPRQTRRCQHERGAKSDERMGVKRDHAAARYA